MPSGPRRRVICRIHKGAADNYGRGLCRSCWWTAHRAGRLHRYPPLPISRTGGKAPRVICPCCRFSRAKLRDQPLCRACYAAERAAGTLARWGGVTRVSTPGMLADALVLRARYGPPDPYRSAEPGRLRGGASWTWIAAQLGVSHAALDKARERAGWPDPCLGRPVLTPGQVAARRRQDGHGLAA